MCQVLYIHSHKIHVVSSVICYHLHCTGEWTDAQKGASLLLVSETELWSIKSKAQTLSFPSTALTKCKLFRMTVFQKKKINISDDRIIGFSRTGNPKCTPMKIFLSILCLKVLLNPFFGFVVFSLCLFCVCFSIFLISFQPIISLLSYLW